MLTTANIFAWVIFGIIGSVAFFSATKARALPQAVIALALMVYPYFVPQTWLLYVIGVALTAGLFIFRE